VRAPHFDRSGLLHTYRSLDFEPALDPALRVENCVVAAKKWFSAAVPFIISVHSINFHSTLAPFRQRTLPLLLGLLCALGKSYPDVLFVNCRQLLEIVETGAYETGGGRAQISVHANARGAGA